jgi:predicted ribosome quality control (RQC) complex YloA/Tae2 family protein
LLDYENNEIEIPLKKEKSFIDNAQYYFNKAKNAKIAQENRVQRLPLLKNKIAKLDLALKELELCKTMKELENYKKQLENDGFLNDISNNQEKDDSQKFRNFDLGDGYMVYVGKNAANNDELTMHFAKPNDIWLHARGAGGSHTVLKCNKNEKTPKHFIKKAAEIAAYYSQARNAKYTPVCYTFKKYVHKPKGANPGSVTLQREEVIMVEPKLPPEIVE